MGNEQPDEFHCTFCQNWQIAQGPRLGLELPTRRLPPAEVVEQALTLSLRFGWSEKPWTPGNAVENVVLHPERLDQALRWREPRMVLLASTEADA